VFILKTLQVAFFKRLAQVLILQVVRTQELLQNGAFLVSVHFKDFAAKQAAPTKKANPKIGVRGHKPQIYLRNTIP
jgi:hypothetical protein